MWCNTHIHTHSHNLCNIVSDRILLQSMVVCCRVSQCVAMWCNTHTHTHTHTHTRNLCNVVSDSIFANSNEHGRLPKLQQTLQRTLGPALQRTLHHTLQHTSVKDGRLHEVSGLLCKRAHRIIHTATRCNTMQHVGGRRCAREPPTYRVWSLVQRSSAKTGLFSSFAKERKCHSVLVQSFNLKAKTYQ